MSAVVAGCLLAFFALALWGYDPQRGSARGVSRKAMRTSDGAPADVAPDR